MALQIQWANGFEDITGSNFSIVQNINNNLWSNQVTGWTGEYSTYTVDRDPPCFNGSTSGPHLRGACATLSNMSVSSATSMTPRLFRPVTDDGQMVLAYAFKILSGVSPTANRVAVGFRSVSGDRIHVRPVNTSGSLWHIGLYINDTLVSTGTSVELLSGSPWVYIEIVVNKTAGTVVVRVSGVPECSATLPVGFTGQDAELTLVGGTQNAQETYSLRFDDFVYYTGSDPLGILKVDGYFKTGNVMAGFSDGTDNGSSSTAGVNVASFENYRASSTSGQEDRFSYSDILPTGIQADSILAVIPSVLASSGSYTNGNLEMRFTSGGTTQTTDVTDKVKPFTPQLIAGPVLQSDPATGTAWTRSGVQAIQTGYRVKT